ncbi:hypothetical protein DFJ58DRAFT_670138 [Suillus subalutaceus]|uniref:uncharacterized protein n=1 Tax=Suillus subalutaceus TaxID=48586 RepID=UPI001B886D28|nr:uncharacterized protein DFJ58DRAFT_670138 [Suillus subalutaceus]KAG1835950.1 hypothetical protein DFJ58DRAFT_670138 [Suillus subalutaceus]
MSCEKVQNVPICACRNASLYTAHVDDVNSNWGRKGRRLPAHPAADQRYSLADHKHSASPLGRNKTPRTPKSNVSSSGFSNGTHGQRSPAVCAVCLGRNQHLFIECSAEHLWDNVHATVSKRVNKQLLVRSSDKPLCVNWQRGCGCTNCSHDE